MPKNKTLAFFIGFIITSSRILPELPISTTITVPICIFIILVFNFLISFSSRKKNIPGLLWTYVFVILWSSLINNEEYPFNNFFVGILILVVPLSSAVVINPTKKLYYTSFLDGIVKGAIFTLIYACAFGRYSENVLGRRFYCGSITVSVITILLLLVFSYGCVYFKNNKIKYGSYILFAIIMALISISKSALISIIVIFFVFAIFKGNLKRLLPAVILVGILFLIFVSNEFIATIQDYIDGNGLKSFTGRDVIWEITISLGLERPLFGHGYNAIALKLDGLTHLENLNQAHNTFVESFYNLGFIGTIILIILFLYPIKMCIQSRKLISNDNNLMLSFMILIIFLLRSFTESGCAQASNLIEVSLFFIVVCYIINFFKIKTNSEYD